MSLKDEEHIEVKHLEATAVSTGLSPEDLLFLRDFPQERRKAVLWKIDVRLVPLLALVYLFSFIDRANIGNANIEGLSEDLNLSDSEYNTCLAVFFIPYVLFEVPSNYILNRFKRPSRWMGSITMAWGVVMTMAGMVRNFTGLLIVRIFLGVTEAGFFPGAVLIVSKWYLPSETQTRIATFYSASALAGAFSGLLAAGIAEMDGIGGLEGWRWIFLLEGIMTVLIGVLCFFCLLDSPALSTSWLDPDEIRYLELRQQADPSRRSAQDTKNKGFDKDALISVVTDWQIYLQAVIYWSNTIPNNALKFTMPKIIQNMGFDTTRAQLLTVPPYFAGAFSAFGSALFADRFTWRMPFIAIPQLLVVIAYAVLFGLAGDIQNNIGACYFAVVLACIGLYPINPGGNAWTLNNLAGPTKRAMGIAYMVCLGNSGGVVGSYIYRDSESPKYPTGFGTSLGVVVAGFASCLVLDAVYKLINMRREKIDMDEIMDRYTQDELDRLGDRSPLFRYGL
ncbi:hypothetical protein FE257_000249 [Aspergillus nanangensis]|uniref:Major facilitator superfamily (MFS) profile domain-containing protein n=1 Tax=Aspergillus nanangensis TaxID=2582783 RepID=A0AAD4H024_ASPNN|nr:hypothetical protein FE257_000249 [Aspergillus nanangensis]